MGDSKPSRTVFRVSRHGLTECRHCRRHLRVDANLKETTCPFCGEHLLTPAGDRGALLETLRRWGGATASGLMAASLLAGCGTEPVEEIGGSGSPDADVGPSGDSGSQLDALVVQPLYGAPAPLDAAVPDVVEADQGIPQPEYGAPPPMDASVPDAIAADVSLPEPLYGAVPPPDASVNPPDAGFNADAQVSADAEASEGEIITSDGPIIIVHYGVVPPPLPDAGMGDAS